MTRAARPISAEQEFRDFNARIENVDVAGLERSLLTRTKLAAPPPFDNRFFNQFVNSPNFTKRL